MDMNVRHRRVLEILRHAVTDIQERVFPRADVDKGGLHTRQDVLHPAFINVADKVALGSALDFEALEFAVFENGGARFLRHDIDNNRLHGFGFPSFSLIQVNEAFSFAEQSRANDECLFRLDRKSELLREELQNLERFDTAG